MKNFYKISAFLIFSMFFMFDANADEWADDDCKEYEAVSYTHLRAHET